MNLQNQIKVFKSLYDVSRETIEKLSLYEKLIIENQKKINLIGRGTMDNIWIRHFADSAKIFNIVKNIYTKSNKEPLSFIDVGSGAGFPGVVINTMAEAEKMVIKTYLIDSNKKNAVFLSLLKMNFNYRLMF